MEQDLHTLLSSVRDDAPPPRLSVDDITTAGRHLARRRRAALFSSVGGGAVAAIAAVTTAVVLVAGSRGAPLTPAVDPDLLASPAAPVATTFTDATPFVTNYRGYTAGDYQVSDPDLVTPAYQQSSIDLGFALDAPSPTSAGTAPVPQTSAAIAAKVHGLLRGGTLVVYRPGAFDPAEFAKGGEKIAVRAGTGWLRYSGGPTEPTLSPDERKLLLQRSTPSVPTLAWQYTGGSWAAIYWESWQTTPARDTLVAIADGLTPAPARQFPVGFVAGAVPHGFHLLSVSYGSDLGPGNRVVSVARLAPKPPAVPLLEPYDFEAVPNLTLSLGRTDPDPRRAGRLDCPDPTQCTMVVGDGTSYVAANLTGLKAAGAVSLGQITQNLQPEDPENVPSWPAALKVFAQ